MNITIDYYPGCDPNEFVSLFGLFVQGQVILLVAANVHFEDNKVEFL